MNIFKTHIYNITLPTLLSRFNIVPFGDVHKDSPNFDNDRWKRFCSKWKKEKKQTYFIGMGDYNDFASFSERKKIRNSSLHESTIQSFDDLARKHVSNMVDDISFMRGRIIGLVGGNHEWEFYDSKKTATEEMCDLLGTTYLGNMAYVRLSIGFGKQRTRAKIDIVTAHGKGGLGKLAGATFNKVDEMGSFFPEADILIQGHDHKKGAIPITHLLAVGNQSLKIKQKRRWLVRSGSFLKGYVENVPSYVVGAMCRPTDLGTIHLDVGFKRDTTEGKDILSTDIHAYI